MNKSSIIRLIIFTLLLSVPFQFAYSATTSELQKELQQKQQELNANQDAVQNKASEAKTISGQITNLNSDIKSTEQKITQTEGQISSTTQNIDELTKSIDQKNKELAELKKKLNSAIVEIYRFSSRSNLDLILGDETLGLTSNQANYIEAIQIQVKSMHTQVSNAKKELEDKKAELVAKQNELNDLKSRQVSYKTGIEYQKTQKDKLLGMTIQQKQDYEKKVQQLRTEITHISADLYAARQKARGREVLLGGGSGYPYSSIDEPDAWGFLTRECTSYAAWYMNVMNGKDFVNTRPGSGSAYNWPNLARDQGFTVSSSPQRGAIISWGAGSLTSQWGHVAIVEAVNGDGTIDISEYNWVRYAYSYRKNVKPGDYGSYSYIY